MDDETPLKKLERLFREMLAEGGQEAAELLGFSPTPDDADGFPDVHLISAVLTYRDAYGAQTNYLCACGTVTPIATAARTVRCTGCDLDFILPERKSE